MTMFIFCWSSEMKMEGLVVCKFLLRQSDTEECLFYFQLSKYLENFLNGKFLEINTFSETRQSHKLTNSRLHFFFCFPNILFFLLFSFYEVSRSVFYFTSYPICCNSIYDRVLRKEEQINN